MYRVEDYECPHELCNHRYARRSVNSLSVRMLDLSCNGREHVLIDVALISQLPVSGSMRPPVGVASIPILSHFSAAESHGTPLI